MNPHRIIFTMVVCVYIFFERPGKTNEAMAQK